MAGKRTRAPKLDRRNEEDVVIAGPAADGGSVMVRLRAIGDRIVGYSNLLGGAMVDQCRYTLHDAMVELDGILGERDFEQEWNNIARKREERGGDYV